MCLVFAEIIKKCKQNTNTYSFVVGCSSTIVVVGLVVALPSLDTNLEHSNYRIRSLVVVEMLSSFDSLLLIFFIVTKTKKNPHLFNLSHAFTCVLSSGNSWQPDIAMQAIFYD